MYWTPVEGRRVLVCRSTRESIGKGGKERMKVSIQRRLYITSSLGYRALCSCPKYVPSGLGCRDLCSCLWYKGLHNDSPVILLKALEA